MRERLHVRARVGARVCALAGERGAEHDVLHVHVYVCVRVLGGRACVSGLSYARCACVRASSHRLREEANVPRPYNYTFWQ